MPHTYTQYRLELRPACGPERLSRVNTNHRRLVIDVVAKRFEHEFFNFKALIMSTISNEQLKDLLGSLVGQEENVPVMEEVPSPPLEQFHMIEDRHQVRTVQGCEAHGDWLR